MSESCSVVFLAANAEDGICVGLAHVVALLSPQIVHMTLERRQYFFQETRARGRQVVPGAGHYAADLWFFLGVERDWALLRWNDARDERGGWSRRCL